MENSRHRCLSRRRAGVDYTVDANRMDTVVPAASQDYILAENIKMDPLGKEGVSRGRLLQ